MPVRQWVLSFPNRLRILLAAHAALLAPTLRIIRRIIASFLISHPGAWFWRQISAFFL